MPAYQTEKFTVNGYYVTVNLHHDEDMGLPWVESEGYGEIRETRCTYGHPEKRPGEVVLHVDGYDCWLYDVQATTEKAKREGWEVSGDTTGLTRAQIVALAVQQDMKYCRFHLKGQTMKKQFNPFPEVSSRYGAPMGRHGANPANLQDLKRLHARHQGGGEGYDKGGAYWGTPSNVWGVWGWVDGMPVCTYVRAASRLQAIAKVRAGEA